MTIHEATQPTQMDKTEVGEILLKHDIGIDAGEIESHLALWEVLDRLTAGAVRGRPSPG